jgi:DNA-binding MarR family transcriptional regulator
LRILEKSDNQPINKLSNAIACTKGNLTGVIDSMVERGLVRRMRSRTDRRVIQIGLTEKAKEVLSSIPPWSEIYRHSLTTKLDEREAKTLNKTLEKLISFYRNTNHKNIKEEK